MLIDDILNHCIPITETGCFIWLGKVNEKGYGKVIFNGKEKRAHRVVYEHFNGSIPKGMLVRHKCDVPGCINNLHLIIGTAADNTADMLRRNRFSKEQPKCRGSNNGNSKLTDEDVLDIRTSKLKVTELMQKYGIGRTTVYYIKKRKLWKHLK
jgi:hypothetical protein